jgi:carbon storage regulator CsrA
MLVLTRKKDEQIRIGENIIITVIRVKGKAVRLGIQAPRTEPVLRGELEFREPAGNRLGEPSSDALSSHEPPAASDPMPPYHLRRPLREFLAASVAKH